MITDKLKGTSDDELRTALEDANIPTLLVVTAQLSGDMNLLGGDQLPSKSIDGLRHISAARQQEIRARAFEVLKELRDGRSPIPPLPDTATLEKMASVYVNDHVGAEYVPMLIEEMGFKDSLKAHIKWNKPPAKDRLARFEVTIIGAGVSGLSAAIHLKKAGIPFRIIEKNDSVGGTWYEHDYPHCGVDTPNHFYSLSFEPNNKWSAFYSKRDELYSYLKGVAEKYGILPHIQFSSRLVSADYDAEAKNWKLAIENQDGKTERRDAKILLSAVGQLNRPFTPDFPGKDSFKGPAFHSARWQHDQDLTATRVAIVGTGASAMQLAPAIAPKVKSLTILQRTKHWIRVLPDYHRTVGPGKQWLLEHVPFYQNWYRFKLFWSYGDGVWNSLVADPDWPHKDRSMNATNDRHRQIYTQHLSDALDGDEALLEKITPAYPPFAKRMLIDNHWCEMLKRDNVELITEGVDKITENAVVDAAGGRHEVDAIIYATGYKAGEILAPMQITGRSGRPISEIWGEDPRAYMGMTTPDFPNFFMFYGPNTNLAHGGSAIFHTECQSRYITKCLMRMIEAEQEEIEVKADIHDDYNQRVDAQHDRMVWTHPKVNSWYRNSKGRVTTNSPWRLIDYWNMTYDADMDDFNLSA